MTPDPTPKLGQSDLLYGLQSPARNGREYMWKLAERSSPLDACYIV